MNSVHRYVALRKASLSGLRAFEAAFLYGSFAAAATDLCVSASAVSHAIGALEQSLGEPLFERHKKNIWPTAAGTRLYAVVREAFIRIDGEMQSIGIKAPCPKAVHVQCSPSLAAIWLMPRLADFLRQHPHIDLHVSALHAPLNFQNSHIDIAIVYGAPKQQADLWALPLDAAECYLPLCSPRLVQGQRLPLHPSMLRQFRLIHNEVSMVSWHQWIHRYAQGACETVGGLRFDRSSMLLHAATQELGMCLDSSLLAREYLRRRQLIMPFGELGIAVSAHWLCVHKAKLPQQNIQTIVHWIRSWPNAHARQRAAKLNTQNMQNDALRAGKH